MTRDDFRRIALSLPEAVEQAHQGSPDFRVRRKIFASFGPKDPHLAVAKLTPGDQDMLTSVEPSIFAPVTGGWGRQGWTTVDLTAADEATVASALTTAWRTVAPKRLQASLGGPIPG